MNDQFNSLTSSTCTKLIASALAISRTMSDDQDNNYTIERIIDDLKSDQLRQNQDAAFSAFQTEFHALEDKINEPTKAKWAANTKLLVDDGIEIDEDNETPTSLRAKIDELIKERVANATSAAEAKAIRKPLLDRYVAWVDGPYDMAYREERDKVVAKMTKVAKELVSATKGEVPEAQVADFEKQIMEELSNLNPRFESRMTDVVKEVIVDKLKSKLAWPLQQ